MAITKLKRLSLQTLLLCRRCAPIMLFLVFNLFFYHNLERLIEYPQQSYYLLFIGGLSILQGVLFPGEALVLPFYLSIIAFDFFCSDLFGVLTFILIFYTCTLEAVVDQLFADIIPSVLWLFCVLVFAWFVVLPYADFLLSQGLLYLYQFKIIFSRLL